MTRARLRLPVGDPMGDAWIRLRDGRELRFAVGNGPHVSFLEPVVAKPS